jgi:hypothetical protein
MSNILSSFEAVNAVSSDVQRKVDLFRRAFVGADHVYAIRTATGWQPVHTRLRDKDIVDHLRGRIEIGSYPILESRDQGGWPMCRWIGADFDGKRPGTSWEPDALRAMQFFGEAPVVFNMSRSGKGAHIRALFSEPVPTWLARRWMLAWLEESGVTRADGDEEMPTSFDRCIPSQDDLGREKIGSLLGCPLNSDRMTQTGTGTLLLSAEAASQRGRVEVVEVDQHWGYLESLIARAWSRTQLEAAVVESSCVLGLSVPPKRSDTMHLNVIADESLLHFSASFCEFLKWCASHPSMVGYEAWVALAANLHTFGGAGRDLFHSLSALDRSRYNADATEWKWQSTADLGPVRCDTIGKLGFRCPHLGTPRCGGAVTPAHFHHWTRYEPI